MNNLQYRHNKQQPVRKQVPLPDMEEGQHKDPGPPKVTKEQRGVAITVNPKYRRDSVLSMFKDPQSGPSFDIYKDPQPGTSRDMDPRPETSYSTEKEEEEQDYLQDLLDLKEQEMYSLMDFSNSSEPGPLATERHGAFDGEQSHCDS